jgi:epoxide hydrolase
MQEMMQGGMSQQAMEVPTGISMFSGEQVCISQRWAQRHFTKLIHYNKLQRGGYFAALEQPQLFVDELRATFRQLR